MTSSLATIYSLRTTTIDRQTDGQTTVTTQTTTLTNSSTVTYVQSAELNCLPSANVLGDRPPMLIVSAKTLHTSYNCPIGTLV